MLGEFEHVEGKLLFYTDQVNYGGLKASDTETLSILD